MTKTSFEIRLEALKLAYDHQMQKNQREYETEYRRAEHNKELLTNVPVPTAEEVISIAEKFKKFIDTP